MEGIVFSFWGSVVVLSADFKNSIKTEQLRPWNFFQFSAHHLSFYQCKIFRNIPNLQKSHKISSAINFQKFTLKEVSKVSFLQICKGYIGRFHPCGKWWLFHAVLYWLLPSPAMQWHTYNGRRLFIFFSLAYGFLSVPYSEWMEENLPFFQNA